MFASFPFRLLFNLPYHAYLKQYSAEHFKQAKGVENVAPDSNYSGIIYNLKTKMNSENRKKKKVVMFNF